MDSTVSGGEPRRFRYRRLLVLVLTLAVVALGIASGRIQGDRLIQALGRFSLAALIVPAALVLVQRLGQMSCLWTLLPWRFGLTWLDVGRAWAGGELVNVILPARSGDIVKIALLAKASSGRSFAEVAGALVVEKVVETVVVLTLLAALGAKWLASIPWEAARRSALAIGGIAALLVIVALCLVALGRSSVVRAFFAGLGLSLRPAPVVMAGAISLGLWFAEAFALRALAADLGLTLQLGQIVVILAGLNLAIAVPVTAANVGPYEAALVVGLTASGASIEEALAIALCHHGLQLAALGVWSTVLFGSGRIVGGRDIFVIDEHEKGLAIGHYQRLAGRYDHEVTRGLGRFLRNRERRAVLELAGLDQGCGRMIDVGCGGGFFALFAKGNGMHVCAVDAAPGMVEAIAGRVDEARVEDIETLCSDQKYDRVVCAGVLDFVRDPATAFSRLCRLTAAGGRLVIATPRSGLGGLIYALERRRVRVRVNLYSLAWVHRMAALEGMRVVQHLYPLPNNLVVCLERRPAA